MPAEGEGVQAEGAAKTPQVPGEGVQAEGTAKTLDTAAEAAMEALMFSPPMVLKVHRRLRVKTQSRWPAFAAGAGSNGGDWLDRLFASSLPSELPG